MEYCRKGLKIYIKGLDHGRNIIYGLEEAEKIIAYTWLPRSLYSITSMGWTAIMDFPLSFDDFHNLKSMIPTNSLMKIRD